MKFSLLLSSWVQALAAEEKLEQHMKEKKDMKKMQETLMSQEAAKKAAADAAVEKGRRDKEQGGKLEDLEKTMAEQKAEIQRYCLIWVAAESTSIQHLFL